MDAYEYIEYGEEGTTATITLNRPKVYNALNRAAKREVLRALRRAGASADVRGIVLSANGKAFCTGQDLGDPGVQGDGADLGRVLEEEWNPLVTGIRDSPKIVVAAVGATVAGAGLSVIAACDLVVAAPGVKFISGFSKIGLAPDAGSSSAFARTLGYRRSLEFFLLGRPLTSEELLRGGFVNAVEEEPLRAARKIAEEVGRLPVESVQLIKRNLQRAMDTDFGESLENETRVQRYLGRTDDYREGLRAFLEKREPNFDRRNHGG